MKRIHSLNLKTSYNPDDYPTYEYIMVDLPISEDTGFYNGMLGYEGCYLLVKPLYSKMYESDSSETKNCIGILCNDSKYFNNLYAGQILPFNFIKDDRPSVNEKWLKNFKLKYHLTNG